MGQLSIITLDAKGRYAVSSYKVPHTPSGVDSDAAVNPIMPNVIRQSVIPPTVGAPIQESPDLNLFAYNCKLQP
jgi:hypothetical protein